MNNDLISRNALIKWIDDSVSQYGHTYSTDMLNMWGLFKDYLINKAPTVTPDMAQVLAYESGKASADRPTGEWYYSCQNGWHCSICQQIVKDMPTVMGKANFDYCPKCGARMEVEE